MDDVYFTIHPTAQGGATDQLTQFTAWYKLGSWLGYNYVHQPFQCSRSSSSLYDFLGFNDIWEKRGMPPAATYATLELPISTEQLRWKLAWRQGRLSRFGGLCRYIEKQARRKARKSKSKTVLIVFGLRSPADRAVLRWIEKAIPEMPDGLDMHATYFSYRKRKPRQSIYQDKGCRILLHIRLGDIATIPTPWHTCLSVYSSSVAEFGNVNSSLPENATWDQQRAMRSLRSYLDPDDYLEFVHELERQAQDVRYSLVVSSDGYQRTFDRIFAASDDLQFRMQQRQQLHELRATHEQSKFKPFFELRNTTVLLGENDENLFDLIHSALTADLIVVSAQQKMLATLLSLYGRRYNPPHLLVLYNRGKKPGYGYKEKLGNRVGEVLVVRLDEIADVMPRVLQLLDNASTSKTNEAT
jgi:hypothetical protein